ncbi:MAG: hypothetical protein V1921_05395 [Candidatus Altiarchaeota archaeon]
MDKNSRSFLMQKEHALSEYKAALHEGDVDKALIPLLDYVNALDDFYTTSSCAGRITLLEDAGSKEKDRLLGKWHRKVKVGEVRSALKSEKGVVWFIYEPAVIHVVCRTLDGARLLLKIGKQSGFKRVGVQSLKEGRFMVEICSTEKIQAPVMVDGSMLAPEGYLRFLLKTANSKFEKGNAKLKKLEKNMRADVR